MSEGLGDQHSLINPSAVDRPCSIANISCVTLDAYTFEHSLLPNLLKIDVEGAEILVIEGARCMLESYKPDIFLSIHRQVLPGCQLTTTSLPEYLSQLGYTIQNSQGLCGDLQSAGEYIISSRSLQV